MLITVPSFPSNDEKKRDELISKLLSEQTVSELNVTTMGVKPLAYEINKNTEGVYFLLTFVSPAFNLKTFEQQTKLLEGTVMRYLLTRKE